MNQTKQKEREAYEPPAVTDIAPVTVAAVHGESPPVSDGEWDEDEGFG